MLKRMSGIVIAALALAAAGVAQADEKKDDAGWVSLFDGKTLKGWKASENKDSVKVEDGTLVVHGPRSHAFYVGEVSGASFTNFEFRCQVRTWENSNSGIYFHTAYQEEGWPSKGYEAQVNNTHRDPRKTGSLYAIKDVMNDAPAKDNEWFDYYIMVKGKQIVIKINGKTTVDYTEPENVDRAGRRLAKGTFAFQAHDPISKVAFRKIEVKVLPD